MGFDKASVNLDGQTLLSRMVGVMKEHGMRTCVVTVLAKLVPLFLQKCACPFFSYALSNCRCQIVKDT